MRSAKCRMNYLFVGEENIHALRDDIQCFALMIYAFGDDIHGFAVICALRNVGEGKRSVRGGSE